MLDLRDGGGAIYVAQLPADETGSLEDITFSAQSTLLLAERQPYPPIPLARWQHRVLQFRREWDITGIHGERLDRSNLGKGATALSRQLMKPALFVTTHLLE